ncbi:uncharacterized protein LOC108339123 [Vigna angularis]|uniref:uncharacterized protein LOC108339123 n=1 Tax=Phaseolus angularis TaxID=3914 RepID=UPI0022B2F74C|nr:uncharacterized protein LOC108339123 [Vigna angularis]
MDELACGSCCCSRNVMGNCELPSILLKVSLLLSQATGLLNIFQPNGCRKPEMTRTQPNGESSNVPSLVRDLETITSALQQQGAALVQQHETALQQLEATRLSSEASQREHVEALRTSPDEADLWIRNMEKIFDAKNCSSETRLAYSEYQLFGEAIHWWDNMKLVLQEGSEIITWEVSKNKFYAEYFPDSVRHAKEVEFLQLVQGDKSVAEYADKFKQLGRFYTQPSNEEWRCRKFKNGLRADIQLAVNPLAIKEFSALVEHAKVAQRLRREMEVQ